MTTIRPRSAGEVADGRVAIGGGNSQAARHTLRQAAMEFRSKVLMRSAWQRYLVAIALTLLVVLGRLALNPWWGVQQNRHLVLLPTVMLATWLGGFRPGVVSALLSALALQLLWSKEPGLLHPPAMDVVLFLGFSLVICGVVRSLELAQYVASMVLAFGWNVPVPLVVQ